MKKKLRIAFISTMMPTPTNVGGPSSLPYQLLLYRPDGILIDIFTLNQNKVSADAVEGYAKDLNCKVKVIKTSLFYNICNTTGIRWLLYHFRKQSFRTLIKIPSSLVSHINRNYDYVWIYPHFLLGVGQQFCLPIVVTGPDSSALHYERCMHDVYTMKNIGIKALKKSLERELLLESGWASMHNCNLHLVGKEDYRYYLSWHPGGHAFYLRHPSNMPEGLNPKRYGKSEEKLSIIVTGKLNIYTHSDMDAILSLLCEKANDFVAKYRFTFVGNGWDEIVSTMATNGYEVIQKIWVEDYFEELKHHDLQLFPISVGTGTKGKVLDALSAGIVCVGSRYAFENIHLEHGVSAYRYENAYEVGNLLIQIDHERELLPKIARRGYEIVCNDHNPANISQEFFQHFK